MKAKLNTKCLSGEVLQIGTPVSVRGKYGVVIKSELVPASGNSGGYVGLHTINSTLKWIKRAGKYRAVDINETVTPNYSFIYH